MSEVIFISPVWHFKNWFNEPIFTKGQIAHVPKIGLCQFLEDCWAPINEGDTLNGAYAKVEVLCANSEIEELYEEELQGCAG